jgi:hypothetical protein
MFLPDVYSQRAVMALLKRGQGGIGNQLQIAAQSGLSP